MARQEALMQEARVKRVWAILLFFTQIGFIMFTYLVGCNRSSSHAIDRNKPLYTVPKELILDFAKFHVALSAHYYLDCI
ncbi:MAG: hypothetical protein HEQ13_18605 [Dolichospermum sp. DEX189]|jgi:hypothetical protein|nr:hypothetical protein AA650_08425 [Anabaena sp. WA102]MBO1071245.1 hypothetical protein [Dolichospermum sp. DEX189]OBQ19646.1 MAG: hypothetical protein AN486_08795 [Anabaena sp. AL93]